MGRPFLEKFADVQWEVSEEHLQAWKDGKTGYPIVDAAMRACAKRGGRALQSPPGGTDTSGWMENRLRMVTASFLVKSLMLDWRLGEKYFMESFIDGDLAANNGGWQWTASVSHFLASRRGCADTSQTGTDPQPYFVSHLFLPYASRPTAYTPSSASSTRSLSRRSATRTETTFGTGYQSSSTSRARSSTTRSITCPRASLPSSGTRSRSSITRRVANGLCSGTRTSARRSSPSLACIRLGGLAVLCMSWKPSDCMGVPYPDQNPRHVPEQLSASSSLAA